MPSVWNESALHVAWRRAEWRLDFVRHDRPLNLRRVILNSVRGLTIAFMWEWHWLYISDPPRMRLGTSSNARFLGGFAEESWVLGGGDLGSVRNGIGICARSSNFIGSRMG